MYDLPNPSHHAYSMYSTWHRIIKILHLKRKNTLSFKMAIKYAHSQHSYTKVKVKGTFPRAGASQPCHRTQAVSSTRPQIVIYKLCSKSIHKM